MNTREKKSTVNVKCLTVGDGTVGKTCMLTTFTTKSYPKEYIVTVLEHQTTIITKDNKTIHLELWDTAGQEEFKYIRPLSYPFTDVFLICFSIVEPTSYKNAQKKWKLEVSHHCPEAIIILVGTKLDLREDRETIEKLKARGGYPITHEQGQKLAEKIGAFQYLECSSLTRVGLDEVFDAAVTAALLRDSRPPRTRKCKIL